MTRKTETKVKKSLKKPIIIALTVAVAIAAGTIGVIQVTNPYVVTVNNEKQFLVSDKDVGAAAVSQLVKDYKAKNSDITKITLDKNVSLEKVNFWESSDELRTFNVKKALNYFKKKNSSDKPIFSVSVVGKTTTEEDYIPETVFKKDENMIAGEERVEVEAKPGRRSVTRAITTVNGKITEEKELKSKILEEGTAEVVCRGTLGLPEGEDWKTYKGDPVFKGEEDLTALSLKYQGAPYKYGGYNIKTGVDCVQFVRYVYRKYGISLPDGHKGLRRSGVPVSYSKMRKGDVICYSGHVAIYIGNGKIIHATSGKGVHVSKVYHGQKIVTVRRIVE